jgi:hypothetical protein
MGWLARVIVSSATVAVVGCASIAGIGDGSDGADQSANGAIVDARPDAAPPSSSGSSGSSGVAADASLDAVAPPTPDASDGVDAAAPCTKVPNTGTCGSNADCCSNQCSAAGKCTSKCSAGYGSCLNDVCCLGLRCSAILLCVP